MGDAALGRKTTEIGSSPDTDDCFSNIGDGGFGQTNPSDDNEEGDANQSLAEFNIEEFLNLAYRVVDGDYASMDALKKLQVRREAKFGRCGSRQEVVAPVMHQQPRKMLVPMSMTGKIHIPPEKRVAVPEHAKDVTAVEYGDKQQVPAGCSQTVLTKGRTDGPTARLASNLFDQRRRCCADVEADMASNGKDEVDSMGSNNAINVAVQLEKRVHDVDKVHEMAYKQAPKVQFGPTGLFIDNIPLHACPEPVVDDKIADAFNNSSRKTLSYIAPMVQNGEIIVCPTLDSIQKGSRRWRSTAVGYFLGKRPCFHYLKEYAKFVWPALREVNTTANGFFFFQFKTVIDMEKVIEGGPWLFQGQPIVLQKWKPGMVMRKLKHTQVPVWIRLRHLPMELRTEEGLSTVASGVRKPLYPDAITRACTRLNFARVCVMLDISSKLLKHIIMMSPDEDGGESHCKIDIEYEWLPLKCTSCMTLGHSAKECKVKKVVQSIKPPVTVYVLKLGPARDGCEKGTNQSAYSEQVENRDILTKETGLSRVDKAKAIVTYNAFDDLHLIDEADEALGGPKACSPLCLEPSVRDLVAEFRLQLFGLIETRWKWFVDYTTVGNRIRLAWDDSFIDVDVLSLGSQFVHARITFRASHNPIIITIIYGANEVPSRRDLWGTLEALVLNCVDIAWMVGGDFNAVRDLTEVCGTSGDIRMAMEEFNSCIQNSGLLPLLMQGEWFIWHNYSASPRNLWKRLDRILTNDIWMLRYPTLSYTCLTPRTSNHSPLVIFGDSQRQFEVGIPMYAVTRKLKALKSIFCELRREKGNLSHNIQLAKGFLTWRKIWAKMQWMKEGDQCTRVFFHKIAHRRVVKRVLQINDGHGFTQTDPDAVILTWRKLTTEVLDLRFLRSWARHLLDEDEAAHLIKPFTTEDVKLTMFDITEDKAPGPDGYSSGFFKGAWTVVGDEVTRALLDFFATGKLLKHVNCTLLVVIPKVHSPITVADFRPISCCNVIYKVIAKLLVQRLSVVLGKLVSPYQAAFIPDRSIGDNIMMAQELFTGYNQKRLPPQCALKVDIRKAYDTVEWDFLLATL
ncbi:UNVERIFIED_CONTAM: hypothetical protein Sindi_0514500 [Sesamum indicum]